MVQKSHHNTEAIVKMVGKLTDDCVKMSADLLQLKGLLHVNSHPSDNHNQAESAEH